MALSPIPTLFRRALVVTCGVLVAGLVVACGSSTGEEETGGEGTGDGYYPVTVSTSNGDVTIDNEPQRIVTLSDIAFENVIALDKTPASAIVNQSFDDTPYLQQWVGEDYVETEISITLGEVDVEAIAAREPDLIVAPGWNTYADPKVMEQLNEVAPTLIFDTQLYGNTWLDGFHQIAEALNAVDKADVLLTDYEDEVAAARESLSDLEGSTFAFGAWWDGAISLTSGGTGFLSELGLKPSTAQATLEDEENGLREYTAENFSTIDGDIVYLSARADSAEVPADSPLNQIPGRVIVDAGSGSLSNAIHNGGILAHLWAPSAAVELLSE